MSEQIGQECTPEHLDQFNVTELVYLADVDIHSMKPVHPMAGDWGYQYAAHAYWLAVKAAEPEPLQMGKAAALAGFHSRKLQHPIHTATVWFDRSHVALAGSQQEILQELLRTYLLEGRTMASYELQTSPHYSVITVRADRAFERAEMMLRGMHSFGEGLDQRATILDSLRATHEARNGSIKYSIGLALRGICRAFRSEAGANSTLEHFKFVRNHALASAASVPLAISRPLSEYSSSAYLWREKYAQKLY